MFEFSVIFFCWLSILPNSSGRAGITAPRISKHPLNEVAYKPGEDVTLFCSAESDSMPEYSWKKDGNILNMTLQHNSGNLVIKSPSDEDDGEYQCFARNAFGIAVTSKSRVQKAVLEPFPTVTDPTLRTPVVGESLSLPCSAPRSYPKGNAYWGLNRLGNNKLEAIENNDRVILDYEGTLHFANIVQQDALNTSSLYLCAVYNPILRGLVQGNDQRIEPVVLKGNLHIANVIPSDSLDGASYVCIINNAQLGAYVQGNDQTVAPRIVSDSPSYRKPEFLWSSPTNDVAIKGNSKVLKCIFAGLPTPKVTWRRISREMSSRVTVTPSGHGTEIEISNVDLDDAGVYECTGENGGSDIDSKQITLRVESAPFWNHGRAPVDAQVDEESDVEIDCRAHGTPNPTIAWFINGQSIGALNERQSINGFKFKYRNVTKSDEVVFQCLASNIHGSILANVILTVNAADPSFIETPRDMTVVQGHSVIFKCHSYGAPFPKQIWHRHSSSEPLVSGDRITVHKKGLLEIKNTNVNDSGLYYCKISNKFGADETSAKLTIRLPTKIIQKKDSKLVNVSDVVYIPCNVTTDPEEWSNIKIVWIKNGEPIDWEKERNLEVVTQNFSLKIKNSQVGDTGRYRCYANNSLDSDESEETTITVRDRPDPPRDVTVSQCKADIADVSWTPGSDNNDPISEYNVFFTSSSGNNLQNSATLGARVVVTKDSDGLAASVPVQPWTTYAFSVKATNSIGTSEASIPSSANRCSTPQVAPYRNPSGVCSRQKGFTQLVIVWEPLSKTEHNGEGFHYVVKYRPLHLNESFAMTKSVSAALPPELTVHDQTMFTKYIISVQSANKMGITPLGPNDTKVGYSGEGVPLDAPKNFRLLNDSLNGTFAEFVWDHVDTSEDRVRGFFMGYQIKFWRPSNPEKYRIEDVMLGGRPDLCPLFGKVRRSARDASKEIHASTSVLWPNSRVMATVLTRNQAQAGPDSNVIEFNTPEGVSGIVPLLNITEIGSSHLRLEWSPPLEPNGIVVSYILAYHVAPPSISRLQHIYIDDPTQLSLKILDLEYSTVYEIFLYAVTSAGKGEPTTVEAETLPISSPDKPAIRIIDPGQDHCNITWVHSQKNPPYNPGSQFFLEYRREAESEWKRIKPDPDSNENWVNVTDLVPAKYEFRIIASNGAGDTVRETRSSVSAIPIGLNQDDGRQPVIIFPIDEDKKDDVAVPLEQQKASSDWFIILICILAFLLVILIIACIVRRTRGDVYPVYEKERMWGHDPYIPEEATFGEYNKSGRPIDTSKSQLSLDSEEKPLESDSDSLGEYEDPDASKFNEDGSFIGQYTRRNDRSRTQPKTGTPAINTFV